MLAKLRVVLAQYHGAGRPLCAFGNLGGQQGQFRRPAPNCVERQLSIRLRG